MQTYKALWMAATFVLVAALMAPAMACDKSGAKASAEMGQASVMQASATCAKAGDVCGAQAGVNGCASACCAGAVDQARAAACTRSSNECARMTRAELAKRGWLGVELQWNEGIAEPTVKAVVPGSPADEAGFRPGDVLTSMSGIPFAPEQRAVLDAFKANACTVGKTVRYTARRGTEIVRLNPTLVKIPGEELDRMIAMHMTAHHPAAVTSLEK